MAMIAVLTVWRKLYIEPGRAGEGVAAFLMKLCDDKNSEARQVYPLKNLSSCNVIADQKTVQKKKLENKNNESQSMPLKPSRSEEDL